MAGRADVTLREPRDKDAEVHHARPFSAEIVRMYGGDAGAAPRRNLSRSREWLAWLRAHPFARMIEADGETVGHVRLHALCATDREAKLAIGLFEEARLGRGIGRAAVRLTLDHAFGHMGLHRVELRVLALNVRAIRCYRACGFRHEGTEREAALIDGEWHDDWIMGIPAHEHPAPE